MKLDDKIKIRVVDKMGKEITILIPKSSDYSLVTDYISKSIQIFNRPIEEEFINTDPGDEQQFVHNG